MYNACAHHTNRDRILCGLEHKPQGQDGRRHYWTDSHMLELGWSQCTLGLVYCSNYSWSSIMGNTYGRSDDDSRQLSSLFVHHMLCQLFCKCVCVGNLSKIPKKFKVFWLHQTLIHKTHSSLFIQTTIVKVQELSPAEVLFKCHSLISTYLFVYAVLIA